jgi:hypothetical protein
VVQFTVPMHAILTHVSFQARSIYVITPTAMLQVVAFNPPAVPFILRLIRFVFRPSFDYLIHTGEGSKETGFGTLFVGEWQHRHDC